MENHKRWWKELGHDIPMMHYTITFGGSSVVILDKAIVKEMMTASSAKENPRFQNIAVLLKNILGDWNLLGLQGPDWQRHRQILQPAFYVHNLKASLTDSVPRRVKSLVQYWSHPSVLNGREIDLAAHLNSLTLDVIGDVAFGHEFHALDSVGKWAQAESSEGSLEDTHDPFIRALQSMFKFTVIGTFYYIFGLSYMDRHMNPSRIRGRRELNLAADKIIQDAKTSLKKVKTKSLLHLLLEAAENPGVKRSLTNPELRDEVKTFIMAGHETTSTFLYWAIFCLTRHPDVQDKVSEEVAKLTDVADVQEVESLEYFNAFLQEVLRLYPPAGLLLRHNHNPERLGGYEIPKRTRLLISIFLLHRHPQYWDDPESFLPERWIHSSDDERKAFQERIRFAFLPFSAGGRNCIGQNFAMIEAKLILSRLIRHFVFQTAPSQRDTKFTLSNFIVLKSKPRVKIVVKKRQ